MLVPVCNREEKQNKADLHSFNLATVDLHREMLSPAAEKDKINIMLTLRSPSDLKTRGGML